ncbi:Deoxyadenosine/deoxycytidine kinase [compost metagenome]
MEIRTERAYWEQMHARYAEWIDGFTACPVLRLNIEEYDVNDPASLDDIIRQIHDTMERTKLACHG